MARTTARKRGRKLPTNVSIRAELVARAKQLNLNLSGLLESAIEHAIRQVERDAWLEANEDAIRAYNTRVEKHGVFSDDWRTF